MLYLNSCLTFLATNVRRGQGPGDVAVDSQRMTLSSCFQNLFAALMDPRTWTVPVSAADVRSLSEKRGQVYSALLGGKVRVLHCALWQTWADLIGH